MSFEKFPSSDLPKEKQELSKDSKVESRFDRYMRKAKYLAKIGLCAGALAIGGLAVKQSVESRRDYRNYYEEKTPETDKERYKELRQKLVSQLGEKTVDEMESGDRSAFWERRDVKETEMQPPKIKGFDQVGINQKTLEKLWSDQGGLYPKKWINGEIDEVVYIGETGEVKEKEGIQTTAAVISLLKKIMMYKDPYDYEGRSPTLRIGKFDADFGHEIGHMNDWESDRSLSLLERAELLSKIADRMRSEHPFKNIIDSKPYYQSFHSENKEDENYHQSKEYWGDLCEGYFSVPEWVKNNYPEDYAIVDGYVKKTDPAFDAIHAEEQRDSIIQSEADVVGSEK